MKSTFIIASLLGIMVCAPSFAAEETPTPTAEQAAVCADAIDVKVNGLVCDFCARSLEKVFGSHEGVSGVTVDLEQGSVSIAMQPGKTIDDATLTELITDSGYNVSAIDRGC